MGKSRNLLHFEINSLKVLKLDYIDKKTHHYYWLCQCKCGNLKSIRSDLLISGSKRNCGCESFYNYKHKSCDTKFYKIWQSMKTRCKNKRFKQYKDYGGRGITYDLRWEDFLEFKKDMYFKYLYAKRQLKIKHPSLERIDVNGDYCFKNCKFIEKIDQNKNKRKNKWFQAISPEGKMYISNNQNEFARKYNLTVGLVNRCLLKTRNHHKGWRFVFT